MQRKKRYMRFKFEGDRYITNMTSSEIRGNGIYGSRGGNIPIKLPDGRFVKVSGWRLSSPPKPRPKMFIVEDNGFDKYAVARLIKEEITDP